MRIATIHIGQETNDFNPLLTTLADYAAFGIYEGEALLERMRGRGQVGGCVDAVAASRLNVEWVPIISSWAMAGGRISTEARLFFEEKIGTGLRNAGPIDALAWTTWRAHSLRSAAPYWGRTCRSWSRWTTTPT
jgi:microcystin degradation protein MlrC